MPFLEKPAESRVFAFALLQPCRGHSRFVRTAVSPRLVTSPTAPFHHSTGTYWRTPAPSRSLGTLVSMASGAESFRHDRSRVGQPKGTDYGEFDRSEQALRVQQTTTGSAPLGFTDTQKERLLKMPLPSQRGLSLVLPADAAPVTDERLTVLRLTGSQRQRLGRSRGDHGTRSRDLPSSGVPRCPTPSGPTQGGIERAWPCIYLNTSSRVALLGATSFRRLPAFVPVSGSASQRWSLHVASGS